MVDKRYQVYIASSYNDMVNERLKLEYALLNLSNVFPWEFSERRSSLNTAKARQQIDDSDYVIFLIGGRYGDLSASGISYLHLDFLYALNKNKNIISFIDAYPQKKPLSEQETNDELIKKLDNFRDILKRDSHYFYEYTSSLDLERAVKTVFLRAVAEKPTVGWVRASEQNFSTQPNHYSEIDRLRKKIADLERQLELSIAIRNDDRMAQSNNEDEIVKVHYRAHAYQDGNLQDIHPQREMSWPQILRVLAPHFKKPALESTFIRALNDYLEITALDDARAFFPRTHAVARTQVDSRSLQQIKLQMKWNNWIVPQQENGGSSRIYWALTQEGQRQLAPSFK